MNKILARLKRITAALMVALVFATVVPIDIVLAAPVADTTKPSATITSPVAGASLKGGFTVCGTSTDDSSVANVKVRFQDPLKWTYINNGFSVTPDINGNWCVDVNGLSGNIVSDGVWGIRLVVTDTAGNSNNNLKFSPFILDNILPTGGILLPANGSYTNLASLSIKGSVLDENSGIDYIQVKARTIEKKSNGARVAETNWYPANLDTMGNYESDLDISSLPDRGDYEICVVAYDKAGNNKWLWPRPVITLDSTDPVVEINTPGSGYLSGIVQVKVTATDANMADKVLRIYDNDGVSFDTLLKNETNATEYSNEQYYNLDTTEFNDGAYKLVLKATDKALNSAEDMVKDIYIDNTTPTSWVEALPEYTTTSAFDISVVSSDENLSNLSRASSATSLTIPSGIDYVELWYRKDGGTYVQYCGTASATLVSPRSITEQHCSTYGTGSTISFDSVLTGGDGFYEFYSIAVDRAGNREQSPIDLRGLNLSEVVSGPDASTTVDTQSPVISLKGDNPLTLNQGVSYVESGWTVDTDLDSDGVVISGLVESNVPGVYSLKYNAKDKAGNVAAEVIRTVNVVSVPAVLTPLVIIDGADAGEVLGVTSEEQAPQSDEKKEVKGLEDKKDDTKVVVAWYNKEFAGMKIWLWILLLIILLGVGYWYFTKEESPMPKKK